MPRVHTKYVCQQCGGQYPTEYGRCPGCSSWNSLIETVDRPATSKNGLQRADRGSTPVKLLAVENVAHRRLRLPLEEFDRVLGGGIVPGSVVLLGGEPGIGKSTLLLQVSNLVAQAAGAVLYVTGEESVEQVKLRADRLGEVAEELYIAAETDVDAVMEHAVRMEPSLLVVDSIQTMRSSELDSASGSVGQIRESTARLTRLAKSQGIATFLVGHVTKDGAIAGPKVLEHMVDTVLYLEGDQFHAYRLLRGVKNRFGATNDVGVFDMQSRGLQTVANPSAMFLTEREARASGSVVTVALEGSRPLLVEIQALVTPTHYGLPRRTTTGIDLNRLVLLTAVLSKRANIGLGSQDIYVNVVGGMRLTEPASDLAVCLAVVSGLRDIPIADVVAVGEVGLGGEVRSVAHAVERISEAKKLGFTRCLVPQRNLRDCDDILGIQITGVSSVDEAILVAAGIPD